MYEHTSILLGTQSLAMGVTLLIMSRPSKRRGTRSESGLMLLAVAMFVLSLINFVEYATDIKDGNEQHSLAIVVFAASVEMSLLWSAYMSMIDQEFINRRRFCSELVLITVFTVPSLFVPTANNSVLSHTLFILGIVFYSVKLMFNLYLYRKQIAKVTEELRNYQSGDDDKLLNWMNSTFYIVLAIGVISIIVPMTGFFVLTIYNVFIFLAYLYIYLSVIRNIDVFEQDMSIIEEPKTEDNISQSEPCSGKESNFIASRQKAFDNWIAIRGYAVRGVTANEVASLLNTNRTKLSQYLKNELHLSYYEWIAGLRIEDAKKQLIEHPDRPVYEIALNVGIEDRDNFRRVFMRFVGMSPSIYRKTYFESPPNSRIF